MQQAGSYRWPGSSSTRHILLAAVVRMPNPGWGGIPLGAAVTALALNLLLPKTDILQMIL